MFRDIILYVFEILFDFFFWGGLYTIKQGRGNTTPKLFYLHLAKAFKKSSKFTADVVYSSM